MYIVYKITNSKNGKSYIGTTKKPLEVRWYWHVNAAKKPIPKLVFHQEIKKFTADVFVLETLMIASSKPLAWEIEKKFITQHNTMHPNGYNMTGGGAGEILVPEIWAKLIGRKMAPESVEKSRLGRTGLKRTDEQKKNISEGCKKRVKNKGFVSRLTEDDVRLIKEMMLKGVSNIEIAKIYDIDSSAICNIRNGKRWRGINPYSQKLKIIEK